jgi:hypothetical protein
VPVQGGEAEDEDSGGLPQRSECEHAGYRDHIEASEEWALKRDLTMNALKTVEKPNSQL